MNFDAKDTAILNHLQKDGRLSNADLAERVHLSPSACLRRVRQLEEAGVIDGYVTLVNQTVIGKPSNIFIEVSLTSQSEKCLDAFEKAVADCPEVMECYLMAGDSDYLLRVVASDPADYERIHKTHLSRLPYVSRIHTSFALRTVCKKTAIEIGGP